MRHTSASVHAIIAQHTLRCGGKPLTKFLTYLDVDHEGALGDEFPEERVGEEHHESGERHEVGAVARHHQDHYVHRHPQHERGPAKSNDVLIQIKGSIFIV